MLIISRAYISKGPPSAESEQHTQQFFAPALGLPIEWFSGPTSCHCRSWTSPIHNWYPWKAKTSINFKFFLHSFGPDKVLQSSLMLKNETRSEIIFTQSKVWWLILLAREFWIAGSWISQGKNCWGLSWTELWTGHWVCLFTVIPVGYSVLPWGK